MASWRLAILRLQINIAFVCTRLADLVLRKRPHGPRHEDRDGSAASLGRTAPTKLDIMANAALPRPLRPTGQAVPVRLPDGAWPTPRHDGEVVADKSPWLGMGCPRHLFYTVKPLSLSTAFEHRMHTLTLQSSCEPDSQGDTEPPDDETSQALKLLFTLY